MSEIAPSLPPGMRPDAAQRRISAFTKRFGEAHLHLAYHAAFPLALTPDLLYRLRANFQRDIYGKALNIPWIAVADLLLSSLCEEVGYEHYEMKVAVRHELLNQLKANERFGPQRITELSNFLIKYVRQQLDSHDPDVRDFAQAQYWTALVATRPEEAAHNIALTLSKLDVHDRAEFARMRSLIEMFGEPSQEFATLLSYVKSMEQYARGDEEGARVGLDRVAGQVIGGRQGVGIRGVELPVPGDLQTVTEVVDEATLSPNIQEDKFRIVKKDCFISYHPADSMWAEWIAWQIEEEGYSVVLQDSANFESVSDFVREMEKAGRAAKNIVLLYSQDYLNVLGSGANAVFERTLNGFRLSLPDDRIVWLPSSPLRSIRVGECDPDVLPVSSADNDLVGLHEQRAREVVRSFVSANLVDTGSLPEVGREVIHTIAENPPFPGASVPMQRFPQGPYRVISKPCPYCGAETRLGDNFCLNCGNRLVAPSTSQQAQSLGWGDATSPAKFDLDQFLQGRTGSGAAEKEPVVSDATMADEAGGRIVQWVPMMTRHIQDATMPDEAGGRIGQEFGNYRLISLIGAVPFADLYLGEHINLKTQAAIRVWWTLIDDEAAVKFSEEMHRITSLKHPNIVQWIEFGVKDGTPFLVMEYARNGSLARHHPKGIPLQIDTVVTYVKQIAAALQYAHNHSVIHGDVKPNNMLLRSDDSVLLSDFGLAPVPTSDEKNETEVMGTPAYMAPEQIQGKPTFASDQYALGVVVYEWLTGTLPFQGSSPTDIVMRHVNVLPSPPEVINPTIPASVSSVVLKALAKRPGDRYGSVQAFADALEQAWLESSAQKATTTPSSQAAIEHPARFVLRAENGDVLAEYPMEKPEISIGRAPNSDILLSKDKLTSRRHATVRYENGSYVLYDERSANGTFVNGQQLEEMTPCVLQDGDHIGIGEHELVFHSPGSTTSHEMADLSTITVLYNPSDMTYGTRDDELVTSATSDYFSTHSAENGAAISSVPQMDEVVLKPEQELELSEQKSIAPPPLSAQTIGDDNKSRLGPGTILAERYRIEKMVALGGIVAVYRAADMRSNLPCAVKEIIGELQSEEKRWQAEVWFQREMTSMLNWSHPSIPRAYDFFERGNRHYLVMEWIEGQTLSGILEKEGNVAGGDGARGVSEARARNWGQQLCNALSYLHRQSPPIIFRALGPWNVMVTDRDEVELVDFDIARIFEPPGTVNIMNIGYPAPEQLFGEPEPRSDVYALGATLHRVLTNQDVARNKSRVLSFPSIRTLRPDISPEFEQVVMKALQPELEKRWASAADMERAILNLPSLTRGGNTPVQVPSQQPWPQAGMGPASSYISSAQASLNTHGLENAFTAIQQAFALELNNALVHKIFGQIYARRQPPNIDNALQAYNRSLELNPNDAETYKLLGDVRFFLQKQPAQAIPHYGDSLHLNENDAGTHYRLAQCFQQIDQLDEALSEYQQAVRLAPDSLSIQFALAQLARSMKKLAIAERAFVRAVTLYPGDHQMRFLLCQVYEEEGKLEDAVRECNYVVQGMPENKEAREMLERLRSRLGR